MPWTEKEYPASMKNLSPEVREKAIEIANALLQEEHYDEGKAIRIAISKAEEWGSRRGISIKQ
ncbi:hypothetical protein NG798_18050 [Ancylothrix sp. C2]|uniref:hypothetical protein n=1 Tax=Ancylothrix sp. D3o TaxID=2953691 RepID=UPI0021BB76FB|nr:hypothetical protein [Ancylothrix sp. D3o]MCT7951709.1 hypothetical protein [Ancylothrix sp. D3o]